MAVERLPPGIDRIAFLDRGPQFFEQKLAEAIAVAGRISFVKLFQRRGFDRRDEIEHALRIVNLFSGIADADDDHLVDATVAQSLNPTRLREAREHGVAIEHIEEDRKSTRLKSSH